jgi:hypothetical protein
VTRAGWDWRREGRFFCDGGIINDVRGLGRVSADRGSGIGELPGVK